MTQNLYNTGKLSFLILIFTNIWCINTQAQTNIDSLFDSVNTHNLNHQEALNLNDGIRGIFYSNPIQSLQYAKKLDSLIEKTTWTDIKAETKNSLGLAYYVNEKYDEAITNLLLALRRYEYINDEPKIAEVLNNLASVYQVRKEIETSIQYFKRSLELFEKLNDTLWIASVSGNLGGHLMEYDLLEEADVQLSKANKLFRTLNHNIYLGFTQLNQGSLKVKQGKQNEAITFFNSCLSNVPYDVNPLIHAVAFTGLGQAFLDQGNMSEAKTNLLKGYAISKKIKHKEQRKSATELLSRFYEAERDYKSALLYQREWSTLQDSILSADQDERLINALKAYETEKKEQEISLLSAENEIKDLRIKNSNRNLILSLLTLLAISIAAFQFYRSRTKTRKLNAELQGQKETISKALVEKDILLREIHHRVKNNLQVISSLLGIQSRKVKDDSAFEALQESRRRVQSMSLIHQDLYKKENLTGIEIKGYFQKLVSGLFETYNISDKQITIEADIDDLVLDVDTVIPLGLVINELISNALKYAFPNKQGNINVSLKEMDNELHLSVKDDGIGIKSPDEVLTSDSYGYDLINSLVDKLDGELSILCDVGTQVKAIFKDYKKAA